MVYRLVFSPSCSISWGDVEEHMSLDDVQLANFYLDAVEEQNARR